MDTTGLTDALSRKDKEISVIKMELCLAKDLLSKKEETHRERESSLAAKFAQDTKRLMEELLGKDR